MLEEQKDYYFNEEGYMVFTAEYQFTLPMELRTIR